MAQEKPPRPQLPHSFFSAFGDPAAAKAARKLSAWAEENRLVFQAGENVATLSTYYVRVPDTIPASYLLTLQPDATFLDVPFRRMLNGVFAGREARLELLMRLRRAVPSRSWDDRVVDNARHGFAPIEWHHITGPDEFTKFLGVLEWALGRMRQSAA